MDKIEAKAIVENELLRYRGMPYADLLRLLEEPDDFACSSSSDVRYQVEIHALWDDEAKRHLRVIACIDDGGWWSTFSPVCDDFIMRPDNTFVGE